METKKNYHEANFLGSVVENLIIGAIIFALVITVLDEFATVFEFTLTARNSILIASFATDLLFTVEFAARLIVTSRHGAARHYMVHQRGWIDLISSVPLMLLSSGPEVLIMLNPDLFGHGAGLGFMSSIKIVKAVRVSRILRLLRLLKIMGKIQNTDSQMANRHIAVISTIATISFITVYSFMAFTGTMGFHDIEQQNDAFYKNLAVNVQTVAQHSPGSAEVQQDKARELISNLMLNIDSSQSGIAQIYYKDALLLSNFTAEYLNSHFKFDDSRKASDKFHGDSHVHAITHGDMIIYVNTWPVQKEKARVNIMVFFGISAILLSFMFVYSRHFVQNVTDVVHVIQKGVTDANFNLEVSVREDFASDEIFALAKSYNETLLPEKLKSKATAETTDTGGLSMDDFLK